MWEEDPRWQAAQYRVFVAVCILIIVVRFSMALVLGEWELGTLDWFALSALAAWAGCATSVFVVPRLMRALFRRLRNRSE
jgi:hypothetical protein